MSVRDAILRGLGGATEVQDAFRLRDQHEDGLSSIDVFGVIENLGIPLVFKKLDQLLGACVRVSSTEVGILLTSERDLHMQRFTAAHELGHFILEHEGSLDREVRWAGDTRGRALPEVEADAFAAEFLMPKWLVRNTAKRRRWWGQDPLRNPQVVYQLALRLGTSFAATCWTLASHDFIGRDDAMAVFGDGKRLKPLKTEILNGGVLDDPWADVWLLGPGDDGATLDAGPTDLFVFDLEESAAGGYRWDPRDFVTSGFRVVGDTSDFDQRLVGGGSRRRLVLAAPPGGTHDVVLPLRRSFARSSDAAPAASIRLSVCAQGARKGRSAPPPSMGLTVH